MSADKILPEEYLAGGDTTVFVATSEAFGARPTAITDDFKLDGNFTSGDHLFRTPEQNAGPLLNSSNCQGCHINDGRGSLPPTPLDPITSMLVKIGNASGAQDPTYGFQLQTFARQSFFTSDFESGWPVYNGSVNGDALYGE
ncbi:MAG: hypothetical protein OIF34_12210, partial [Porticoccaceae bacterium]|nr:hypothetical protein [Porticoccaceae bacterium]